MPGIHDHNAPPAIQQLLRRCLHKDKNERLQDIGDARIELRECMIGTSMTWSTVSASLPLDGGEPQPLVQTGFYNDRARFSPDGRWVAYRSNESRPPHVYVSEFVPPRADGTPARLRGKWQLSSRDAGPHDSTP